MAEIYAHFKGGIADSETHKVDLQMVNPTTGDAIVPEMLYIPVEAGVNQIYMLDKEIPLSKNAYIYVFDPTKKIENYAPVREDFAAIRH